MSQRARALWIAAVVLLTGWAAASSLVGRETRENSWLFSDQTLNLGLDLRGGIHWLLHVDEPTAFSRELQHFEGILTEAAADEGVELASAQLRDDQVLELQGDAAALGELVEERIGGSVDVEPIAGGIELRLNGSARREALDRAVSQALEVLERRVNRLGVTEPVLAAQGAGRVLVQMPGGEIDPAGARAILENTTFLEFKKVLAAADNEELLRARYPDGLPEGTAIAFTRTPEGDPIEALLVPTEPVLTGDMLQDARVGFDRRNRPEIDFTWNGAGTAIFREFTSENVGERMAAIIDGEVVTAPVIQDRIGRQGRITGSFTQEEAAQVAISLRSGALPIPLQIEEERSVGPALGADSIANGVRSIALGGAIVIVFMLVYYSLSGLYANVALLVNLVVIIGLMSMAGATLTLPGIAGLVLTVGMAVDANVIIFERIREELRRDKSVRNAVAVGFTRSRLTILDANVTTLIAAVVLLYFGRGPVQGFGVTLAIGIVSSVFCALTVTRLLVDLTIARGARELRI